MPIMKNYCRKFSRVQLLLLIGVTTSGIGCEAFVGRTRSGGDCKVGQNWGTTSSTSTTLFSSSKPSQDPILLEGKLVVLQDVVKELDARHQKLVEKSTTAQQEYDQKLKDLLQDLQESEKTKQDAESEIAKLEEAIEQQVLALENLEQSKNEERLKESQQLKDQNEESLDQLKAKFESDIQALEKKLESKTAQAKDLSEQLETATMDAEKDALIEELKEQIAAQQKQMDASETTKDTVQNIETDETDDSSALEELKVKHQKEIDDYKQKLDDLSTEQDKSVVDLKAQHQTVVKDYENKLNALAKEKDESLLELKAQHLKDVEDYESRLDSIFADKEEVSNNLMEEHESVVEDYEIKLQAAQAASDQLVSELAAMETKCEEQVAIATASVQASEAREANLRQETKQLTRQVQMYWIAAKLANILQEETARELTIITVEHEELQTDNEELNQELDTTKKGIQDLIEQLENQSNMWQKLRSKVSRKRWKSRHFKTIFFDTMLYYIYNLMHHILPCSITCQESQSQN